MPDIEEIEAICEAIQKVREKGSGQPDQVMMNPSNLKDILPERFPDDASVLEFMATLPGEEE